MSVKDIRLPITRQQREFLESPSWGTVYRGGIGSGKSFVLCVKAVMNAMAGRKQLICSFSYPMLRDVIRSTLVDVLGRMGLKESEDWTLNKTEMVCTVRGTEILMRSGDAPDSLRGLNVHDFLIDEARQFRDKSIFDILIGRIRNAEDSRWYMCTTTNGKDWVWKLSTEDSVKVIVQRTDENPFLPEAYIQRLKEMYSGTFAAQELDGDIVEMIGEVINPGYFNWVGRYDITDGVRYWDLAFTQRKKSDYSVGALCTMRNGKFVIADIIRVRAQYPDLRELIVKTALGDGRGIRIGLEEAGQQRAVIDDLAREKRISQHVICAQRPHGTKLARAMPWVSRAGLGQVDVVQAHWKDEFVSECAAFRADETHPHDDQVDAVSGAYSILNTVTRATSKRVNFGG